MEGLAKLGKKERVLLIPRISPGSMDWEGCFAVWATEYGSAVKQILPALGTHVPMTKGD